MQAKWILWPAKAASLCVVALSLGSFLVDFSRAGEKFSDGWTAAAQRDEIRPRFAEPPTAGLDGANAFTIETSDSEGDQGWFQKTIPVVGGEYYRFSAQRRTENVAVPRRSAIVRVVWQDASGKPVKADVPEHLQHETGAIPLAEPDFPLDGAEQANGWTDVTGVHRAPSAAKQARVELHLQWAPAGKVVWSQPKFIKTDPPPRRLVRLAGVHYRPSGQSPRKNCEEYAPLVAEAARQRADLVVLGETIPSALLKQPPHELAEPIPGPSTDYFASLAAKHETHIVFTLFERDGKVIYNTAVLLGPDGKLLGKYRKVCLPHSEVESGVTPGKDYPVFDTKFGKLGLMVCYDGFFPEVARELTNRGADVIAWPVWGCNPLLGQARACENHVYVVSSTFTDAKSNWMRTAVYDHAGRPLAQAENWGTIALAEVDLSQRHFWRNNLGDFHNMVQRHRPAPATEAPAADDEVGKVSSSKK